MVTIISKDEKIGEVKRILNDLHDIKTPFGWEIVFAWLLDECKDNIEVHDFGKDAYFITN